MGNALEDILLMDYQSGDNTLAQYRPQPEPKKFVIAGQEYYAAPSVFPGSYADPDYQAPPASETWKKALSMGIDFMPGPGDVKAAQEAITGNNLITGEPLAWWERGLAGLGALPLVPSVGGILKKAGKGMDTIGEGKKAHITPRELGKAGGEKRYWQTTKLDSRIEELYQFGKQMRDEVGTDLWDNISNKVPGPYPGGNVFNSTELDGHVFGNKKFEKRIFANVDFGDNTQSQAFNLGFHGYPLKAVEGWRYGDIPPSGRSTNYREQVTEKGISLMAIDDMPEPSLSAKLYEAFNAKGKKKINVGGYFVGFGSDGEPLIIGARELSPNLPGPREGGK